MCIGDSSEYHSEHREAVSVDGTRADYLITAAQLLVRQHGVVLEDGRGSRAQNSDQHTNRSFWHPVNVLALEKGPDDKCQSEREDADHERRIAGALSTLLRFVLGERAHDMGTSVVQKIHLDAEDQMG